MQPREKLCALHFVPREGSAGVAEVCERGGQSFAGPCHISAMPRHTHRTGPCWDGDGEQGCSSGHDQSILVPPERICGVSGGPAQLRASPCTSGVFSCSWAPTCSSPPAHGEARNRRRAASCSLKVIWQLQREPLTAGCGGLLWRATQGSGRASGWQAARTATLITAPAPASRTELCFASAFFSPPLRSSWRPVDNMQIRALICTLHSWGYSGSL